MRHEKLFALATPYLEKNDFGAAHTKRVFDVAKKHFDIPKNIREKVYALIILHDIGGSSVKDQYEKGPRLALKLMKPLGYPEKTINEVCVMISTHHERLENPLLAFKILYDADQLVKFSKEEFSYYNSRGTDWNAITGSLYHAHAKTLARKMLDERILEDKHG
ncbi:MAG: HD domain-containing protein [Candidatus Micrarchaeota archaeon]